MKNTKSKAERLDLETADITSENIAKIGALFPNCLTEAKDEKGRTVAAIDFDKLRQELSHDIVEGADERYRFDWPEKRKATILANTPTRMTLRPCREESVEFDTTQNLYIEGDNLEVLKLLRETYFGKVKMIYIDPPYNTGKDSFVYDDDFMKSADEFAEESDAMDEDGNRMFDLRQNNESNGRFHTDWLNMMYSRLKVAKDLLTDDGVIFISIDDNEFENLRRLCNEMFGEPNFIGTIVRNTNSSKNQSRFISVSHEYCLVYAKNKVDLAVKHAEQKWEVNKNNVDEYVRKVQQLQEKGLSQDEITEELKELTKYPRFTDMVNYWYFDSHGLFSKGDMGGVPNGNMNPIFNPLTGQLDPVPPGGFRFKSDTLQKLIAEDRVFFHTDGSLPRVKRYLSENLKQRPKSIMSDDQRPDAALMQEFNTPFDNPKQLSFMQRIVSIADSDSIVLDFFSGSATTAHAVMQLNAEDNGTRHFIMVQLQEGCPAKSEAAKAGYKNICEIGKERIRRAGKKILEEVAAKNAKAAKESAQGELELGGNAINAVSPVAARVDARPPDVGFRVLKLDTSNMEEVYYSPKTFAEKAMQGTLNLDGDASLAENIKQGRTGEDLLFQSMLRLDVPLSAKIETEELHGKRVFVVDGGYMMATFDKDVNEETIKAIAKRAPSIFVMCDGGFATDNVADNFEQIWKAFSPDTVRRVI